MRFPIITTRDLNKRQLALPHDLEGEHNATAAYSTEKVASLENTLIVLANPEEARL